MRYLLPLLTALSLIPTAHAFDRAKLMDSFFSIVMIRGYNQNGSLAYGSGVIVAPNKVLTNCHIFRQTKEPWISRGEDTYTIASIQADRWHDLCLITTDNLPFKPATLGKASDMKKGEEVIAIGHSSGSPAPVTSLGTVKSAYPLDDGIILRSTARFALGASGSGLFNEEGQLVGINTFKTIGRVAYFYAVPIEWLDKVAQQPAESVMQITGKAFWEEEEDTKPYFLRIAVPELQEDWLKLEQIAQSWAKAEPNNTEAWYELGWAEEKLARTEEAEKHYRKSLALDANNTDALFRIGVIANDKGDKQEVHKISLALINLDKNIAEEFGDTVGCKLEC
ncbi:trypsin-like peptidase domain-containing protein [Methylovorus sp. MP688]|uniref:trypsin-like peptidase domain-containing protein n=1 Tax=Methylovorus sp. (strain MP688) TaxID=887061 RepID=UPI0001EC469F|nr:trypsin-like peptidase domain-containing protein [Methylovorus sp. MP688]ADQ84498.1 TPR repeat-containing protein [Methylovorus sp. MP688]